jgi:hypothetical protein
MDTRDIDPRFSIARTYDFLNKGGIDVKDFEAELMECESPFEALRVCLKWREIESRNN